MKHKVSELEGALLNAAVAKCEGFPYALESHAIRNPDPTKNMVCWLVGDDGRPAYSWPWVPSSGWSQGGPIIERERIVVCPFTSPSKGDAVQWNAEVRHHTDHWIDQSDGDFAACGPTPLIAAMRAYVASKFGEDVDIP